MDNRRNIESFDSLVNNVLPETGNQAIVQPISKFSGLVNEVINQSKKNQPEDIFQQLATFKFNPANGTFLPSITPLTGGDPIFLSDHAWRQMCQITNIPYRYISTIDTPALQNVCMNHAIQRRQFNRKGSIDINRTQMIRTMKNGSDRVARAILSDRYAEFDDHELLRIMVESISDKETSVVRSHIDPWGSSKFWITWDTKTTELRVGDTVKAGIQVTNSETGKHSVDIRGMTYRLWCLNGATTPNVVSQSRIYHSGNKNRMKGLIKSTIEGALEDSGKLVTAYQKALDIEIKSASDMLDIMIERSVINAKEKDIIEENIEDRDRNNLFGISQAITRTAQDRNFEREGQLIELGAHMVLIPQAYMST